MIYLLNTTDNTINATLTSDSTSSLSGTSYILQLKSPQENHPLNLSLTDISTHSERYNKFSVPSASIVNLTAGYYDYTFTQSGSAVVLETGKCTVTTVTGSKNYDTRSDNQIRYVDNRK